MIERYAPRMAKYIPKANWKKSIPYPFLQTLHKGLYSFWVWESIGFLEGHVDGRMEEVLVDKGDGLGGCLKDDKAHCLFAWLEFSWIEWGIVGVGE
jgi:hypothetical protein